MCVCECKQWCVFMSVSVNSDCECEQWCVFMSVSVLT